MFLYKCLCLCLCHWWRTLRIWHIRLSRKPENNLLKGDECLRSRILSGGVVFTKLHWRNVYFKLCACEFCFPHFLGESLLFKHEEHQMWIPAWSLTLLLVASVMFFAAGNTSFVDFWKQIPVVLWVEIQFMRSGRRTGVTCIFPSKHTALFGGSSLSWLASCWSSWVKGRAEQGLHEEGDSQRWLYFRSMSPSQKQSPADRCEDELVVEFTASCWCCRTYFCRSV